MSRIVVFRALRGDLTRLPVDADTLDEATLQTGHGTYSVFRTYPGLRVLRLDAHLDRMRRSADLLGEPFSHSDEDIRAALRRAVEQSGLDMPRIRLTVPFDAPESLVIALEPFAPPPAELFAQGVRVGLSTAHRERPQAKDSRFIERRRVLQSAQAGVYEVLLCADNGAILEGTSSNFYAVRAGRLLTAGEGMLLGIARSMLLEVAPAVLPIDLTPAHLADLPALDEALLTSSSRGVVPIVQIGETVIGSGVPGPFTQRLRAAYDARVEAELELL